MRGQKRQKAEARGRKGKENFLLRRGEIEKTPFRDGEGFFLEMLTGSSPKG
jgi:hypothetical protein